MKNRIYTANIADDYDRNFNTGLTPYRDYDDKDPEYFMTPSPGPKVNFGDLDENQYGTLKSVQFSNQFTIDSNKQNNLLQTNQNLGNSMGVEISSALKKSNSDYEDKFRRIKMFRMALKNSSNILSLLLFIIIFRMQQGSVFDVQRASEQAQEGITLGDCGEEVPEEARNLQTVQYQSQRLD
jgi:hypothetical protein